MTFFDLIEQALDVSTALTLEEVMSRLPLCGVDAVDKMLDALLARGLVEVDIDLDRSVVVYRRKEESN